MATNAVSVVITGDNQAGPALDAAMAEIDALNAKVASMATGITSAGEQASFSMQEARGTAALFGEEVGVRIPRHIATFVAQLPGVGAAMSAAFSGVAIIGIIELLGKGIEKLDEFIEAHDQFAQAQKLAEAAINDADKSIEEQATELGKLEEAYELIGLKGAEELRVKMEQLQPDIIAAQQAVNYLTQALLQLEQAQELSADAAKENMLAQAAMGDSIADPGALSQAENPAIAATKRMLAEKQVALQVANQQMANLQKQYDQAAAAEAKAAAAKALADQQAAGEAELNAEKTIQNAKLQLIVANAAVEAATGQKTALELVQIQADANEQKYQNDLYYLNQKLKLLELDPDKNVNTLKELNAQIEALELDHLAKQQSDYANFVNYIVQEGQKATDAQMAWVASLSPSASPLTQLMSAYDLLGVKAEASYADQVSAATKAYQTILQSGLATDAELAKAQASLDSVLEQAYPTMQQGAQSTKTVLDSLDRDFGNLFTSIASGQGAATAFQNFGKQILNTLAQMDSKMFVTWTMEKLIGLVGSFGGGGGFQPSDLNAAPSLSDIGASFNLPQFAGGGYDSGPSIVGERGPELFIPDSAGTVIPNSQLGGAMGGTNNYFMDFSRAERGVSQEVRQAIAVSQEVSVNRAKVEMYQWNRRRTS